MSFFLSEYDSLHMETDQLKRIKSALKLKMDSVNVDDQTGKIKNYDVTLDKCTCTDFGRRHKPCKHIYRLAMELGIFNGAEKSLEKSISQQFACIEEKTNVNSKSYSYVFSYHDVIPKNFVVLDFETANICADSICQIGIVVVENNLITESKRFLIRPPYVDFKFADVHGITFDDVKDKPTFGELWQQVEKYITGHTIATYNLPFDLNCLISTLSYYDISYPNFTAFDVLSNVRGCRYFDCELSELRNYKLTTVAEKLGFEHRAHDALSDALVTAQIQLYLSNELPEKDTLIYFPTVSALCESVAKSKLSLADVRRYCYELFDNKKQIKYDEYKELFKLIEQMAACNDSADLYKYCGMFYEECKKFSRALVLYKQALSLDEKIRVKGKIKSLEKILRG